MEQEQYRQRVRNRVRKRGAAAVPSESTYRLGAVMIGGIAGEAASGGPGICGAAMIGGAAPGYEPQDGPVAWGTTDIS